MEVAGNCGAKIVREFGGLDEVNGGLDGVGVDCEGAGGLGIFGWAVFDVHGDEVKEVFINHGFEHFRIGAI